MASAPLPDGVEITGPLHDRFDEVLTPEALTLLATLHRSFDGRRRERVAAAQEGYADLAARGRVGFLAEAEDVREREAWRVAVPGPGVEGRWVEIDGPTDRKMT